MVYLLKLFDTWDAISNEWVFTDKKQLIIFIDDFVKTTKLGLWYRLKIDVYKNCNPGELIENIFVCSNDKVFSEDYIKFINNK